MDYDVLIDGIPTGYHQGVVLSIGAFKTAEEGKDILPGVGYSTFASGLLCISLRPGAIYLYICVCIPM